MKIYSDFPCLNIKMKSVDFLLVLLLSLPFAFKTNGVPPLPSAPPSAIASVSPAVKCFERCLCQEMSVVKCTHLELTTPMLKRLVEKLSNETEVLYLHNNKLTDFTLSIFGRLYKLREVYLHTNLLTRIPDHKHGDLRTLKLIDLNKNNITEITETDFIGYGELHTLHLSSNGIASIKRNTFNHLVHLRELFLENNNLMRLPSSIFESLLELHKLSLNFNEITMIQADLFDRLEYLRELTLARNQITLVSNRSFSSLKSLVYLDLTGNRISILPQYGFSDMTNIGTLNIIASGNQLKTLPKTLFNNSKDIILDLEDNMLNCNCDLLSAVNKIQQRSVHLYIAAYSECLTPREHAGLSISSMTYVDLKCRVCDVNECDNDGKCSSDVQQKNTTTGFNCDCTDRFSGKFCQNPKLLTSGKSGSINRNYNESTDISSTGSLYQKRKQQKLLKAWVAISVSIFVILSGIVVGVVMLWRRKRNKNKDIYLINDVDDNTEL